jgi:hypothetical protein
MNGVGKARLTTKEKAQIDERTAQMYRRYAHRAKEGDNYMLFPHKWPLPCII